MEKKIYEAEMFIIPNAISVEKKGDDKNPFWDAMNKKMKIYFGDKAAKRDLGKRRMIQVWITSKESDNWADHGCPVDGGYFISNLPTWMIGKMKEGDTITVDLPNHNAILKLKAAQLKYRYARFGAFEKVLEQLGA